MKTFLSLALLSLCSASPLARRDIVNTPEPVGLNATSPEDIAMALKLHNDGTAAANHLLPALPADLEP